MKEKSLHNIYMTKAIFFCSLVVVSILLIITSIYALAPLCKIADGTNFDGTWSYNDEGSGNDWSVTCRNGRLTSFCVTPALSRGAHWGIYTCEGSFETSCKSTNNIFNGLWSYDDHGSGNDFAVVCKNGKLDTFLTFGAGRGEHPGETGLGISMGQVSCANINGNGFNGTWHFNDYGSGNDFAVVCRNNEMTAFCVQDFLARGFNPDIFSCSGNDKDQDENPFPDDCNDSDPAVHPGATEICNGIDDNCNGQIDEAYGNCNKNQICYKGKCELINCKNDSDCNDNNPNTADSCLNPGTISSICVHNNIYCNSDSDCGTNSFSGNPFCQAGNVFQNFITYKCNNPGLPNSTCSNSTNPQLKQTCLAGQTCLNGECGSIACYSNSDCNDNNPNTADSCLNPGTFLSSCQHNNIECHEDSDCGTNSFSGNAFCQAGNVFQNFITYKCNNPGLPNSTCSNSTNPQLKQTCLAGQTCLNGECGSIACYSNSDCNDNNPNTADSCLNPGTISSICVHNNIYCNSDSDCGTNGFSGNPFCQAGNVFQNFITYKCNNPGCSNSTCSSSSALQLKQTCSDGCNNGSCIEKNCTDSLGTVSGVYVASKTSSSIKLKWINPTSDDFFKNIIFINDNKIDETKENYYKASGLESNSFYKITITTMDKNGKLSCMNVTRVEKTNKAGGGCYNCGIDELDSTIESKEDISYIRLSDQNDRTKIYLSGNPIKSPDLYFLLILLIIIIIIVLLIILLVLIFKRKSRKN